MRSQDLTLLNTFLLLEGACQVCELTVQSSAAAAAAELAAKERRAVAAAAAAELALKAKPAMIPIDPALRELLEKRAALNPDEPAPFVLPEEAVVLHETKSVVC